MYCYNYRTRSSFKLKLKILKLSDTQLTEGTESGFATSFVGCLIFIVYIETCAVNLKKIVIRIKYLV